MRTCGRTDGVNDPLLFYFEREINAICSSDEGFAKRVSKFQHRSDS